MIVENLYDEFITMFPDDALFFKQREEECGVERDTMILMFSMIVSPFLLKVVNENSDKSRKAFDFIEQMANSGDSTIENIAEIGVLETILTEDEGAHMEKITPYLGPKSQESIRHMSRYYNLKHFRVN